MRSFVLNAGAMNANSRYRNECVNNRNRDEDGRGRHKRLSLFTTTAGGNGLAASHTVHDK